MERRYIVRGEEYLVEMPREGRPSFRGEVTATISVKGVEHKIEVLEKGAHSLDLVVDGRRVVVATSKAEGGGLWVSVGGRSRLVRRAARHAAVGRAGGVDGPRQVTPSFPATVVRVLVETGAEVEQGQPLVVVSAMKMEMTLEAPHDGTVVEVNVTPGQAVGPGDELVVVEAPIDDEETGND